ncbi:MAG: F0F1 ATP synthase subunit A [Spirochaetota bacterium]
MNITPDQSVFFRVGGFAVTATIGYTWMVMALLVLFSWLATRRLTVEPGMSRWQNFMETLVGFVRNEIRNIIGQDPDPYLPFIGTLFLLIALSNLLTVVPRYQPPTGSLYTTSALALCVFLAVPLYGIRRRGLLGYLRKYIRPTPFMLPFNVIGELSRTLALSMRLFGNVMSGTLIVAILVSIAPLFLPIFMQGLGLLIGLIQAYIFAILSTVYIASAAQAEQEREAGGG